MVLSRAAANISTTPLTGCHLLQGQDLASGNLTAPAVYALQTAVGPELEALIKDGFEGEYGQARLGRALHLVKLSGGMDSARQLARREADEVRLQLSNKQCNTSIHAGSAMWQTAAWAFSACQAAAFSPCQPQPTGQHLCCPVTSA